MITSNMSLATPFATIIVAAGVAFFTQQSLADESPEAAAPVTADDKQPASSGISSNLYFTDENGNRRMPTAAEVKAAAEAVQKDMARLAGKHKGKVNVQKQPDGTVSATVGLVQMEFLTVRQNDDGTLTYGHTTMGEDGKVANPPANVLPEK